MTQDSSGVSDFCTLANRFEDPVARVSRGHRIVLHVPPQLERLADRTVSRIRQDLPVDFKNLQQRIHLLAREQASSQFDSFVRVSVPFDLLSLESDDKVRAIVLVRGSANQTEREDIRRRMIYLSFFCHYAFGNRKVQDVLVAGAFYADEKPEVSKGFKGFGPGELMTFDEFWNHVSGRANGGELIERLTQEAVQLLRRRHVVKELRSFLLRRRVAEQSGR